LHATTFVAEHGGKDALAEEMKDQADEEGTTKRKWLALVRDHESKREEGSYSKSSDAAVTASDTSSLTARRFIGYFWSPALYRIHHNDRTPKDDGHKLQTIHGRKGVLLPPSHGKPLGVEDLE
jgi:hypothetical protein